MSGDTVTFETSLTPLHLLSRLLCTDSTEYAMCRNPALNNGILGPGK